MLESGQIISALNASKLKLLHVLEDANKLNWSKQVKPQCRFLYWHNANLSKLNCL